MDITKTIDRAGLTLAYDDSGHAGRPPMVLLHGWCDRRTTLDALTRAFTASHRVIRLDLPGHGDSQSPDRAEPDRLSITELADDVAALCDHLGVDAAVVIGHSLGGAVAVELAVRRPALVTAVLAIEGTVLFPEAAAAAHRPLLEALRSPHWLAAIHGLFDATHLPTDDPALLAEAKANVAGRQQHVVAGVPEQLLAWDARRAAEELGRGGIPVLYVEAKGGLADLDRFGELVPQLSVAKAAGVGHAQVVATPDQVVPMVERFLAVSLGRDPVDNLGPVIRLADAIEEGDMDVIDDLVSADFVDHGAPPGLVPPGPDGYKQIFRLLRSALDTHWELLDVVASGERVMLRVRNHGRHVGELLGIPPTHRTFSFEAMHVYRVEDGVIREHWAVRDDLALFTQLGLIQPPI